MPSAGALRAPLAGLSLVSQHYPTQTDSVDKGLKQVRCRHLLLSHSHMALFPSTLRHTNFRDTYYVCRFSYVFLHMHVIQPIAAVDATSHMGRAGT